MEEKIQFTKYDLLYRIQGSAICFRCLSFPNTTVLRNALVRIVCYVYQYYYYELQYLIRN